MTDKERGLLLDLTKIVLRSVNSMHDNDIAHLAILCGAVERDDRAAEASAILAEAIAGEAGKQIDTEIAATTVGSRSLDLHDAVTITLPDLGNGYFIVTAANRRSVSQAVLTVEQMRMIHERITQYFESVDNKR